jgi:hypothetical protein
MITRGNRIIGRRLLFATLAFCIGGGLNAAAAEHPCGDVSVEIVAAPVPGGTGQNRCGSAWTTCGSLELTVTDDQVTNVKRSVSVQQKDGQYGPFVETEDCGKTFGACAWDGPPKIVRNGNVTIITETLRNWAKRDEVGTWKQAKLDAYCQ